MLLLLFLFLRLLFAYGAVSCTGNSPGAQEYRQRMLNQTAPAWSRDTRHLWLPWSIPQGVGAAQAFHDRKAAMKCLFVLFLWHFPNSGIWLGDFRLVINLPGPLFQNLCSAGLDEMFSTIPSSSTCGIPKRLFDYYLCFSASPGICPH